MLRTLVWDAHTVAPSLSLSSPGWGTALSSPFPRDFHSPGLNTGLKSVKCVEQNSRKPQQNGKT